MDVRPFESSDGPSCLGIFDSLGLDSAARRLFDVWLDEMGGRYFVMEHEGLAVACGGYSFLPDGNAALKWGMVSREFQKQGLGRFLLMYRIREIGKNGAAGLVVARVPSASAGFYEKQGFRLNGAADSGWVEALKKLTVCA